MAADVVVRRSRRTNKAQGMRLALLLLLLPLILGEGEAAGRSKRALAFRKGSTFFYRLNFKENIVPSSTIFSYASGFKVAWELPVRGSGARQSRSSLRDVREAAASVFESHGFNGKMCLLKSLCQAMDYLAEKDGVLMKILQLLSGSAGGNGTSILDPLVCVNYANHCPLHLIGFNAFAER